MTAAKRILLDASVLELPVTGMARALLGLYGACLALRLDLQITGLNQRPLQAAPPFPTRAIACAARLHPGVWRRTVLPACATLQAPDAIHYPWRGGIIRPLSRSLVVMTIHDVIPLALPALYFPNARAEARFRERLQQDLDRVDLVLTVSEYSRQDICRLLKPKREPVVVHNACLLPKAPPASGDAVPESYHLYLGGFDPRKGLDVLLPVYRRLYNQGALRVPLYLVGETRSLSPEVDRELAEGKAEGSIIEKGYVSDEALAVLLRDARSLVYPSLYEGFGLPPLEAMAQGCPVLTTRGSSLPEVCGDAALYVAPGSADELESALLTLDRDPGLRERLRQNGLRRAVQFSWERSARIYLDALDNALTK